MRAHNMGAQRDRGEIGHLAIGDQRVEGRQQGRLPQGLFSLFQLNHHQFGIGLRVLKRNAANRAAFLPLHPRKVALGLRIGKSRPGEAQFERFVIQLGDQSPLGTISPSTAGNVTTRPPT